MREITVIKTPGNGVNRYTVRQDATWADLIDEGALDGRKLFVDGAEVSPMQYGDRIPSGSSQVFATGTVKGN